MKGKNWIPGFFSRVRSGFIFSEVGFESGFFSRQDPVFSGRSETTWIRNPSYFKSSVYLRHGKETKKKSYLVSTTLVLTAKYEVINKIEWNICIYDIKIQRIKTLKQVLLKGEVNLFASEARYSHLTSVLKSVSKKCFRRIIVFKFWNPYFLDYCCSASQTQKTGKVFNL